MIPLDWLISALALLVVFACAVDILGQWVTRRRPVRDARDGVWRAARPPRGGWGPRR